MKMSFQVEVLLFFLFIGRLNAQLGGYFLDPVIGTGDPSDTWPAGYVFVLNDT